MKEKVVFFIMKQLKQKEMHAQELALKIRTKNPDALTYDGEIFSGLLELERTKQVISFRAKTNDGKMRISVPCLVCAHEHSYIISSSVFFDSDVFIIPCSLSGVDICFIGREKNVSEAVDASNKELLSMLGEEDIAALKNREREDIDAPDPQILDIVRYVINELNEENAIYCNCEQDGDYVCDIHEDHVTVRCTKCGASIDIPTNSTVAAHDFLEVDKLILK